MKFFKLFTALCVLALVGMLGCEQDSPNSADLTAASGFADALTKVSTNGTELPTVELIAAKSIDVGDVTFDDVDTDSNGTSDALQITYSTSDGWTLVSTDLWIGSSLSDMPDTRKGDPKPRKFPYRTRCISETSWTITVPFEAIGYQCGDESTWYVAAHAVVRKLSGHRKHRTESAWSGDTRFRDKRGHWATYSTIVIECDGPVEPPVSVPHDAFAYSPDNSVCLADLGFGGLGWTNLVAAAGTYTHVLYADPSGCLASGGTAVGTVTLEYDGISTATVTFTMTAPYTLNLAAVYYGVSEYPPLNAADYPIVHTLTGATSDTFTITDFSEFSYFVARASVDGF